MKTIKNIEVRVVYKVGLGELNVPDEIYEQLAEMYDNELESEGFTTNKYNDALEWLSDNIKERDAYDWNYEIEEFE